MKFKKVISLILATSMLFALAGCGSDGSSTEGSSNDSGKTADKNTPRIIAGSVATGQILDELKIPMIGRVSTQYELPKDMQDLPEVGLPMSPDVEKIMELEPDKYILSGSLEEIVGDKLAAVDVPTEYYDLSSYDAVFETIKEIGKNYGKEKEAEATVKRLKEHEAEVLKSVEGKEPKKVMILFGAPGAFLLATKDSFAGSLVDLLKCENIANGTDIKGAYVPFSMEVALKEDPDIILRMYHGYIDEAMAQVKKEFEENPQWQQFTAVREGKVYDLDDKIFNVTGNLKADESLSSMRELLYGDE
ncbi:MAG: heme ABC transporter substrate-binding protein IsdE [Andreesenia angusta]|nr:heme ABC transporter substrate-binding protein IsdE [Andreesenia angusta]